MRAGDFSDFRNQTTGAVVPIYDPWTQCGINNPGSGAYNGDCGTVPNRLQFPGNIIPSNRINSIARSLLAFPIYADPTVSGPWRNNNYETNAQIGGDNNQLNFRSDYNVNQNVRMIGRYTRMDSTNAPVDLYGNGQLNGDPYSPEHFITTQAMLANTWTINSTTVLDARFGFLRWDYDREPGNLGINLTQQFGFAQTPYGEISQRSGIPGMETIPSIAVTNNNTINTGLIYADDRTYTFTPTLTKIKGDHTIKVGANWLRGEVNYFQNNNPGGTFAFTNAPTALDGTNPGSTGDGFAAFLLGLPTGGTYQSSSYTYGRSTYQAYFAEDSWQVNDKLTVNLGLRWEIPGVFTEKDDNLTTFNPDVVNPLLTGITNPVTGQPFLGAFELVNTDAAAGAWHAEEPARPGRASPRLRISDHPRHGDPRWRRQVHRPLDGAVPGRPDRTRDQQRVNNMQPSADNNRTFIADLTNPFPNGVQNYPGRSDTFQQALLGGGANQFIYDPDGYPGSANQWNIAVQHQFGNGLSVEATYMGLDGNHLANTLNYNQLGLDHINRAANDTSVCSLTNNAIIPFGAPGYASNQRDTCYGAFLRQLVANPLAGLIREGNLSTATVQRALLLLQFPQYSVGQSAGLRRPQPLQRHAAARRQALRRRQHHQRQLHLLEEHDQCRDGDQLARVRRRESDGRLPDQRSRQ